MYYNTKRSSLPQGAKPVFKAGLNRWESIQLADMQKAEATPTGNDSEWWSVDITIPKVSPACLSVPKLVLAVALVHTHTAGEDSDWIWDVSTLYQFLTLTTAFSTIPVRSLTSSIMQECPVTRNRNARR